MTDPAQSPSRGTLPIRICLLGPVTVEVGRSPLAVDTRKAVALLAYLAVTRRPASREAVAALLWPEADGPGARGALRRTLSVLRAGLGDRGLVIDRSAVGLDPSALEVDVWRFEEALAVARGHEHPGGVLCPVCRDALREAVALGRGEFMAGFALRDSDAFDEWQLAEGASYRRELAAVLERLARGEASARAWALAAPAARRWLELDSLHEPAHRLLMEVLARSGEPAAALTQYRDCVRILDRELGVAPLSETTGLAEEIRAVAKVQAGLAQGEDLKRLYGNNRVWGEARQRAVGEAARRLKSAALAQALRHAARIDRTIKGLARGDVWDELLQLCLRFAR